MSGEPISEIVMRLREELTWEPEVADLMSKAADELERLLWKWKVHDNVVARLRLTAAEREAIFFFAAIDSSDPTLGGYAATLRSLLERTK